MAAVARLRNLLSSAQALTERVKGESLETPLTGVLPTILELSRLVRRFSQVAQALTPDEGSAAWQQRSDWLQADMVALAHERIWSADAQEMSARLLLVLFASADACDATLREKAETELLVRSQQAQLAQAQARAERAEQLQSQLQAQAAELLEARSQVTVFQQQLAQVPELNRRRQQLEVENEGLRQHNHELQRQVAEQQTALKMLMAQAEAAAQHGGGRPAQRGAAGPPASSSAAPAVDDGVLRSSLEANARVVEKLIALNEELMDRYNAAAAKAAVAAARAAAAAGAAAQQALGPPQEGGPGPPPPGLPLGAASGVAVLSAPQPGASTAPTGPAPADPPAPSSLADAFSAFLKQ